MIVENVLSAQRAVRFKQLSMKKTGRSMSDNAVIIKIRFMMYV